MRKKIIVIFLLNIFVLTSGFGCKLQSKEVKEAMKPITLSYWRVWDDEDAFTEMIANYQKIHPNINIEYRKFRYDEYEQELINALSEDRGPDIFSIPNTWMKNYENKIAPMPDSITMAYPVIKGTIKKETIIEMRTNKSLSLKELKNNFVDVVTSDVVIKVNDEKTGTSKDRVFGLPLFVDTLAMFYNKDLFNNGGIAEPPAYWNRIFQQYVKKLTKQNTKGEIIQSGVALGGSTNVERANDILSVLMMQNGAVMMNENEQVMFNTIPPGHSDQYNPGLEALRFYTDFANPAKEVYSWNKELDNSLKMFTQNNLAIMFGYAYHLPIIRADAPKLNFAVAKLPQIENSGKTMNFANYWVESVSKKSKYIDESWDFIQFITKAEQVKSYLDKTKKPTALRALVDKQIEDQDIGVFAEQVLTAKSWYHGKGASAEEKIIHEMVDSVNAGASIEESINLAARRVQQTVK
ncbi:MAG: Extracellular solute-binding protein family 1 [Parcubacteria group bacterium GW2011_GWE2_39_37]|uniref:Extracellular solute-binding protein family 1 n=1 Tax=Candidatus Falkowbacteria bacterium GW2011_GWF2_39_8 TaxID=1618642 RepID=A0A0G0T7I0_9BACT|nr:MAG: Extracellular solute-binding protein family 1 [Parcubacteria group bacterium GW2011_GWE2_39_37]KKR33802.1 MAG: Extracellular solute-binding protein family 1 [Candidatus Falkowbacteria bacterium GW2011_GWF2_39_8]